MRDDPHERPNLRGRSFDEAELLHALERERCQRPRRRLCGNRRLENEQLDQGPERLVPFEPPLVKRDVDELR